MEVKHYAFELKASDDARTIEGMGSVFGNVDSDHDMVMPGAFARTLKARSPAMLWQHKRDQPIGVWDEIRETPEGLYMKGRILETQIGNDAYTLAKAGALKGLSIGYGTKDSEIDKKSGVRHLKDLDLWEVSLVTFPANEQATISRVKNRDGSLMTERQFEEFLRDAGRLSQKEAMTVVSKGYKELLNRRDGDGQELEALSNLFKQFKT